MRWADVYVPVTMARAGSSISSSGDGPTSPGGVAVDRAGGGSGRWLSLSWWWACERLEALVHLLLRRWADGSAPLCLDDRNHPVEPFSRVSRHPGRRRRARL